MATPTDIARMSNDIGKIIRESATSITIKRLSSVQPKFNNLMKEINGEPSYDTIVLPAIIEDSPGHKLNVEVEGNRFVGKRLIRIPNKIEVNNEMVDTIIQNNDTILCDDTQSTRWRILEVKHLVGEILIEIQSG